MMPEDLEWAPDNMTLADATRNTLIECAEAWWQEQGGTVSSDPEEWDEMYNQWVDFIFGPE